MGLKIAAFDIEATSLNASYGRVLCACFKFADEKKVRSIVAFRKADEKKALQEISEYLDEVDVLVSWYGKQYDIPFVDARCLRHKLPPTTKRMHIDLCLIHKYRCRTRGHHLDGVAKDLEFKNQKFEVVAEDWQAATDGDRPAFDRIHKHCVKDVLITEEALDRMKGLLVNITR